MLTNFDWASSVTSSPIFGVLIGCSIVTLAVAFERLRYFWKRSGNPAETLQQATAKIEAGLIREAAWIFEQAKHPIGPVGLHVIKLVGRPLEIIEERMHIALSEQKLLFERNLNVLGTMAAVAPLIGLLGTVWGIMRAFQDMAATGSAAPSVVAAGVAEALVTTAAGLIVAVPAVMLYNHFSRKMNVMLTEAENGSRTLRATLTGETTETSSSDTITPTRQTRKEHATPEPAVTV